MTLKLPRLPIVEGTADRVLRELGITALAVNPFAIAEAKRIMVRAKPPENDGFSGMLARSGSTYGIIYSTYIESEGFQRFSVAHELGHYFLPGHVEKVLAAGTHYSTAGFSARDVYEQEADYFAAALLMPTRLIQPLLKRLDGGLDAVLLLADQCGTSLTAASVRYARLTRDAVAIILSTNGQVDFCSFSPAMKASKAKWLERGDAVPAGCLTRRVAADRAGVLGGRREIGEAQLSDWFDYHGRCRVIEEVIGLGRYAKILTVLHAPRITEIADGLVEEEDEEEAMAKSWTVRFRK